MKQKQVDRISFIQSKFGDWLWKVVSMNDDSEIDAQLQIHEGRREVDDYRLCGLYDKPKNGSEVFEVEYKEIEGMRIHEEIVHAYYKKTLEALERGNPIIMAGGHCTWAPGVVGALSTYLGDDAKIGIIWIDAHGDCKTEITSDNRLLAGMPLGTILGFGMERWRLAGGLEKPLDGKNVLISDYRVKTPEVKDDMTRSGIKTLDTDGFNDKEKWKETVGKLAENVDAVYLHIDIDILKSEYIPMFSSVFETPGGNDIEVVMDNIKAVMETGKVYAYGVYNTMFDTNGFGRDMTAFTGMRLIAQGIESWKTYPAK